MQNIFIFMTQLQLKLFFMLVNRKKYGCTSFLQSKDKSLALMQVLHFITFSYFDFMANNQTTYLAIRRILFFSDKNKAIGTLDVWWESLNAFLANCTALYVFMEEVFIWFYVKVSLNCIQKMQKNLLMTNRKFIKSLKAENNMRFHILTCNDN